MHNHPTTNKETNVKVCTICGRRLNRLASRSICRRCAHAAAGVPLTPSRRKAVR